MRKVSRLKAGGYLISTASVILLGCVSWQSAASEPALLASLLLGMVLSIVGMEMRWRSHRLEQTQDAQGTDCGQG